LLQVAPAAAIIVAAVPAVAPAVAAAIPAVARPQVVVGATYSRSKNIVQHMISYECKDATVSLLLPVSLVLHIAVKSEYSVPQ
jgi:uncharacterized protein YpuA (DUF1002 family)